MNKLFAILTGIRDAQDANHPTYGTAQVSSAVTILGVLNMCAFLVAIVVTRGRPDFEGLPAALVALGAVALSGCLYLAGMLCLHAALKSGQHVLRSVIALLVGSSPLVCFVIYLMLQRH